VEEKGGVAGQGGAITTCVETDMGVCIFGGERGYHFIALHAICLEGTWMLGSLVNVPIPRPLLSTQREGDKEGTENR
jgi:hypothetical protein